MGRAKEEEAGSETQQAWERRRGRRWATTAGELLRWCSGCDALLEGHPLPECYCTYIASRLPRAQASPASCRDACVEGGSADHRHCEGGKRIVGNLGREGEFGRRLDRTNGTEDVHQAGETQGASKRSWIVPFPFVRLSSVSRYRSAGGVSPRGNPCGDVHGPQGCSRSGWPVRRGDVEQSRLVSREARRWQVEDGRAAGGGDAYERCGERGRRPLLACSRIAASTLGHRTGP
ncbi:hypothetical protein OH76DRAFT_61543 [Lentinus brumalis]|uniref:Uncharacterized protein n=1 Tax=Lentinus brumalis TaxID=2498619 RepID=A0A371DKE1_9APHY|nr:hypothetical protein OH76DRAFT_61543 [Polyporus brumalis]